MTQLYSNNAKTTLGAQLSTGGTTATLTSGDGFKTPTGSQYELLTLTDGTDVEIVRMTARSGVTATIERAQEGTTAQTWPEGTTVYAGITAATLQHLATYAVEKRSAGFQGIALGDESTAGSYAVALGREADAGQSYAVAIGWRAEAYQGGDNVQIGAQAAASLNSVSVGRSCWSDLSSVALGAFASAAAEESVAIGRGSEVYTDWQTPGDGKSVAIGRNAMVGGDYGVAVGHSAEVEFEADGGIALGLTFVTRDHTFQVGALPVVPRVMHSGFSDPDTAWQSVGAQSVITTTAKNLRSTAVFEFSLPTEVTFYIDEVGVIVTSATSVTGQPTVQFGISGDVDKYVAPTETSGLTATTRRHRFTTLGSSDGATNLRVEITTAATGTALMGKFYWRGWAVSNV